jgi:ankyrin repeat protein
MLGDPDPSLAPDKVGGPRDLHPLNALCQSVFLKGPERAAIHAAAALLLEKGADPNVGYEEPMFPGSHLSPLYGAIGKHADGELGKLLLEAGANPNDGESLYHSTEHGDPELIQILLDHGAKVDGSNAMRRVLDYDFPEGLRRLLLAGGDPEARAEDPRSPICWAIWRQRSTETIRLLLEFGADPTRGAPHGQSYFRMAIERGLPEIAALFPAEELSPVETFVAAVMRGDEAAALATGVTASDLRDEHKVMLSEAAAHNRIDAVRLMLKLGWPVGFPNRDWNASALNQAVFHGNVPMTELLLENGANWETERHGYGDNVRGTLDFGSRVRPNPHGDYLGCARLLVKAGMTHGGKDWPDEIEALFDMVE